MAEVSIFPVTVIPPGAAKITGPALPVAGVVLMFPVMEILAGDEPVDALNVVPEIGSVKVKGGFVVELALFVSALALLLW